MIDNAFIARMANKCLLTDDALDETIVNRDALRIQTVNLHHLALAQRDQAFADVIDSADYVTADGWPIVSLMRAHGAPAKRVTGSELVSRMVDGPLFAGHRVGILGAKPESGDAFHTMLEDQGMEVVYREHGMRHDWDTAQIARELIDHRVELLLVAVTPPYGDEIAASIRGAGFGGVLLNIGGSISMITGEVSFAPNWIRQAKIEWFYRFAQEPNRLFRRYFVECLPVFVRYVLPAYRRPASAETPLRAPNARARVAPTTVEREREPVT